MLLMRRFEEKAGQLYGQQKIRGFCHLYIGQEACVAGAISALTKEDKWKFNREIQVVSGNNKIVLDGLSPNRVYFYRIKIMNDQGIMWSYDTQSFNTLSDK